MELSKRLEQVVNLVNHETVADIGTDHGYVPIALFLRGKIKKAFACDVRKGPLEKAKANIRLYGAEEVIETRLGSGLLPLRPFEAETAVMAGMGGMLIVHILQDSPEVAASLKELVLSPQRDFGEVRKYLHAIGFSIAEEHMLKEEGKVYTLMRCVRGTEKYGREIDYLYGKQLLEKKDPLLREFLEIEEGKYSRLANRLRETPTEQAIKRLPAVEEKLAYMKEALECLSK
ncbi:MAG: SAM-dependent methyltransferase [Anaerotignum sp.]|nr:SAM-dependent methyltransferase [Anaerotignum sp.]